MCWNGIYEAANSQCLLLNGNSFAAGTPYAGGLFRMKLVLGKNFPSEPPKGFFTTKIFHPNVASNGEICVNTLKKDWKAELGIKHILLVRMMHKKNLELVSISILDDMLSHPFVFLADHKVFIDSSKSWICIKWRSRKAFIGTVWRLLFKSKVIHRNTCQTSKVSVAVFTKLFFSWKHVRPEDMKSLGLLDFQIYSCLLQHFCIMHKNNRHQEDKLKKESCIYM